MKPNTHNFPKIVIVGRPNVGKSTLFNRIIKKRKSVVEKCTPTTRDRVSEIVEMDGSFFELIDTGGVDFNKARVLSDLIQKQVMTAVKEADEILLVCDAKSGILPLDKEICGMIRKFNKPTVVVANKVDNKALLQDAVEFYDLGLGDPVCVSGLHGTGINDLLDRIIKAAPYNILQEPALRIAVVGRPNSGKSSFVNSLMGEERVIVSPESGTTRDSIDSFFVKDKKTFIIVDTAGIRSKGKIKDNVSYYSILRTMESIKRSNVVVALLDGMAGVTKEDFKIIDLINKEFRPFLLAVNKWDLGIKEGINKREYEGLIRKNLKFINNAPILFISALTGENVTKAVDTACELAQKAKKNFSSELLNNIVKALDIKSTRIYSIRQVNDSIPHIEILAKRPALLKESDINFIKNRLRNKLGLEGIPVKITFKKKTFK